METTRNRKRLFIIAGVSLTTLAIAQFAANNRSEKAGTQSIFGTLRPTDQFIGVIGLQWAHGKGMHPSIIHVVAGSTAATADI